MDANGDIGAGRNDPPPQRIVVRRSASRRGSFEPSVQRDLPYPLPITEEEIALLTHHLGDLIAALLAEPA